MREIMNSKRQVKGKKAAKIPPLTAFELEQSKHQKEIKSFLNNIGYLEIPGIEGKEFHFKDRTGEIDGIFYNENVILIIEYTIGDPGAHLLKKNIIFNNILEDKVAFVSFLMADAKFKKVKEVVTTKILQKYTLNQLQIEILYASKKNVQQEHKNSVKVHYLDYPIVKYFESISKVIKKTAVYEFHDFIGIKNDCFGKNINKNSITTEEYEGHILPEEHSSFKHGYKLISFYIDANSLMRRAYVLRNGGWRDKELIILYQRMLNSKKISLMRKYLNGEQRVFVNNIIATLPEEKVTLLSKNGDEIKIDDSGDMDLKNTKVQPAKICIKDDVSIIGIVDGQHRTFAYHEGNDKYESKISQLRNIQNLLVTGILFPKDEPQEERLKFQAKLFLEINSTQQSPNSGLKQSIESILEPFSSTSISKQIITGLNSSGPLESKFECLWFDTDKIKITSIISFGLKPIVKFGGIDSFYALWDNADKQELLEKKNYELLKEYQSFCLRELRIFFSSLKYNIPEERWAISKRNSNAVLNLTFINAAINCLRQLIKNKMTGDKIYYNDKLKNISTFEFHTYKTTHYNKMGIAWFNQYFK